MKPVLIDTNVLIDYLRASKPAIDFIEQLQDQPTTSVSWWLSCTPEFEMVESEPIWKLCFE